MQIQQLQTQKPRRGFDLWSWLDVGSYQKKHFHLHFSFPKPIPHDASFFFPSVTWLCAWMWLASYLKTLRCVSLHNGIGRLFIRAKIKKVFFEVLLSTDRPEPFSGNSHPMITCLSISEALCGPFPLLRLIWGNGSKLAAKLERGCFHTEGPSESLSLSLPHSLIPPIIISPIISPVFHRTLGI